MEESGPAPDWLLQSFELKCRSRAAILRQAVAEAEAALSVDALIPHKPVFLASVVLPSESHPPPLQRPPRLSFIAGNDTSCAFAAAAPQSSCTKSSNETCDSNNNSRISSGNDVKEKGPMLSNVLSKGSNLSCLRRPGSSSQVGDIHGSVDSRQGTIKSKGGRVGGTTRTIDTDPDVAVHARRGEKAAEFKAGCSSPSDWQDLAWRKRRRRAAHLKKRVRGLYAVNAVENKGEEDQPIPPTLLSAVAAADAISPLYSGLCGVLGSLDLSHISAKSSVSWDHPLPSDSWELTVPQDIDGAQLENMSNEESAAALAARIHVYIRTSADLDRESRGPESVRDIGGQRFLRSKEGAQLKRTGRAPDRHNRPQAGSSIEDGCRVHRQRAVGCASGRITGQARGNEISSHEMEVEQGSEPGRDRVGDGVGGLAERRVLGCSGAGHDEGGIGGGGGGGGGAAFLGDRVAPPSPLPPHPIPLRPTPRRKRTTAVPRRQTMHTLDSNVSAVVGAHGKGSDCDRAWLCTAKEQGCSLHRCRSDQVEEVTPGIGGVSARVDHFCCGNDDAGAGDSGDSGRSRQNGSITPRGVADDRPQRQSQEGVEHGAYTDTGVTRRCYIPLNGEVETAAETGPAPLEGVASEGRSREASMLRRLDQASSVQSAGTDECSAIDDDTAAALVEHYNATQRSRLSSSSKTLYQSTRCSMSSLSEAQSALLGDVKSAGAEAVEPSCAYREVPPDCVQPHATGGKEEACIARAAAATNIWRTHSSSRALNVANAATGRFGCMAIGEEKGAHGDLAHEKEDDSTRARAHHSSKAHHAEPSADDYVGALGGVTCHPGTCSARRKPINAFAAEQQLSAKEDLPAIGVASNTVRGSKSFATFHGKKLGKGDRRGTGNRVVDDVPNTTNACGQQQLTSVGSAQRLRRQAGVSPRQVEDIRQQQQYRAAASNVLRQWLSRAIRRRRPRTRHSGIHGAADSDDKLRAIHQQEATGQSFDAESRTTVSSKASYQCEKGAAILTTSGQGATAEDDPGDESPPALGQSSGQYNRTVLPLSSRRSWARSSGDAVKQNPTDGPRYAAPSICHRRPADDCLGRLSWEQEVDVADATVGTVSTSPDPAKPWLVRGGNDSVECSGVLDCNHPVTAARRTSGKGNIKGTNLAVPVVVSLATNSPLYRRNNHGRRAVEAIGGAPATKPPAHQAQHVEPRAARSTKHKKQHHLASSSRVSSSLPGASSVARSALKEQQKKMKHGEGRGSVLDGGLRHDLGRPCAVDADWFRYDCGVDVDSTTCRREHEGAVTGSFPSRREREPATIAPMALVRGRIAEKCRIPVNSANNATMLEGEEGGAQTVNHSTRKPVHRPAKAQQSQGKGVVLPAEQSSAPSEGVALALLAGASSGGPRSEGIDVYLNPLLEMRYVRNPLFGAAAGFSGNNRRVDASRALHGKQWYC